MIKKITFLACLMALLSSAIVAQILEPVLRVETINLPNGDVQLVWTDTNGNVLHRTESSPGTRLNEHPTGRVLQHEAVSQSFTANGFSVFIVYRDLAPGVERELWRFKGENSGEIIHSTRRIYDQVSKQANYFHGMGQSWPRISEFFRGSNSQQAENWTFTLGGLTPDQSFIGEIAEVVIYPRVLSRDERKSVNSRIALTYGIPLFSANSLEYRNATERLWHAPTRDPFRHRVTGIGYDSVWHWNMIQAESSYEAPLVSLSSSLPVTRPQSNAFLLWGDNGEGLASSQLSGFGKSLLRTWRLQGTHWLEHQPTDIVLHPNALPEQLEEGERWWLVFDHSGLGIFAPRETSFLSAEVSRGNSVIFENALSGYSLANRPIFTFTRAPDFFVHHRLDQSICDETISLVARPVGGYGPYSYQLFSAAGERLISGISAAGEDLSWEDLPPDIAKLTIQNFSGETYTVDLLPETALYRQFGILPTYVAGTGQRITPTVGNFFSWRFNEGTPQRQPSYLPVETGNLVLVIDSADCSINLPITITGKSDPVSEIKILNNPSIGGNFSLEVTLHRSVAMSLRLIDIKGRILKEEVFTARHFHDYDNRGLLPAGTYQLLLSLDGFTHTRTIIVQ